MSVIGLVTPAPSVGFPFTCEPSVYTKSFGFHFLLWSLVCKIDVVVCMLCIHSDGDTSVAVHGS